MVLEESSTNYNFPEKIEHVTETLVTADKHCPKKTDIIYCYKI